MVELYEVKIIYINLIYNESQVSGMDLKKQAAKYIVVVMVQRVLGLIFFLLAADTLFYIRSLLYFAFYFVTTILSCIVMFYKYPETLSERNKKHDNTKSWDKVLLTVYTVLTYFAIYVIAGFETRLQVPTLPMETLYFGIVFYLISAITQLWSLMENKHFESTARIQSDRNQTVCSSGPYGLVRHPGYSSIIIWAISVFLFFGTLFTGVISAVIITVIVIRTYFEDNMLKKELEGYIEYSNRVKYRLIPYVW